MLSALRAGADVQDDAEAEWVVSIDSTIARARTRSAPGALHLVMSTRAGCVPSSRLARLVTGSRGVRPDLTDPVVASRDREALGGSRGGLSTKIHLLADGRWLKSLAPVSAGTPWPTPR